MSTIDRGERHVCAVVRVPSIEEEDARRPHRERQRFGRGLTGHIIKGLLFTQGIRGIEPKRRLTKIDFSTLRTAENYPLPDAARTGAGIGTPRADPECMARSRRRNGWCEF